MREAVEGLSTPGIIGIVIVGASLIFALIEGVKLIKTIRKHKK